MAHGLSREVLDEIAGRLDESILSTKASEIIPEVLVDDNNRSDKRHCQLKSLQPGQRILGIRGLFASCIVF